MPEIVLDKLQSYQNKYFAMFCKSINQGLAI